MKKKFFLFLTVLIGVFAGTLGYFSVQQTSEANATSVNVSVWDGEYYTKEQCTFEDLYIDGSTYFIKSAKGLSYLAKAVNSTFSSDFNNSTIVLETDIDLGGHSWIPIGWWKEGTSRAFRGNFNGNGHYIYNLTISQDSDGSINGYNSGIGFNEKVENSTAFGFFGVLKDGAKIKDLHFKNLNLNISSPNDDMYVGGLVGYLYDNDDTETENKTSWIKNCSVEGKITVENFSNNANFNVGGVVGGLLGATVGSADSETDIGVKSKVSISLTGENSTASNLRIGGVAGSSSNTKIYNSANEGEINIQTSIDAYVGGLIGYSKGKTVSRGDLLENVYNVGKIIDENKNNKTNNDIGGLVGYIDSVADGTSVFNIKHAYSVNVDAGLIGTIASQDSQKGTIEDAFVITTETDRKDPITTNASDEIIVTTKSVYVNSSKSKLNANKVGQFRDLETLAKSKEFFRNDVNWSKVWDFDKVWEINSGINSGFPYIYVGAKTNDQSSEFKGTGTKYDPYLIETPADMARLSYITFEDGYDNKYYSLQNDLDLTGLAWVPIGYNSAFNGVFDGNNHTISGMTCSLQQQFEYHALFGKTNGAVIKNLIINDVRFVNEGAVGMFASLVGEVEGDTYLINCTDDSLLNTVAFSSTDNLYILYGKNNDNKESGIKYNETDVSCKTGYDIEVDGNGGIFYRINESKEKSVYSEYHVLVDSDYKILTQEIDETYATSLPSENVGESEGDQIIKEGNKLIGFKIVGAENTEEDVLHSGAEKGIIAVWQDVVVNITIVYNAYEKEHFDGVENYKEETNTITYGTYLSEQTQVFDLYKAGNNTLRPGFVISDYYFDSNFKYKVDFETDYLINKETKAYGETSLLTEVDENNYTACTVYAKWKGTESEDKQFKITISKTKEKYENYFSLSELGMSVKLLGYSFNSITGTTEEKEIAIATLDSVTESEYVYVAYFNTLYSDTIENYLKLSITLKDGYNFSASSISENDALKNFGRIKSKLENDETDDKYNGPCGGFEKINDTKFYNICNSCNLNLTVSRASYTKVFNVGEGVHYGIAPIVGEYGELRVSNGAGFQTINDENVTGNGKNIGYDFKEIMGDGEDFGVLEYGEEKAFSSADGHKYVVFKYKLSTNDYEIYVYEKFEQKNGEDGCYYLNLYHSSLKNNSATIEEVLKNLDDRLVSIMYDTTNNKAYLSYYGESTFALIFSTEENSVVITEYAPSADEGSINYRTEVKKKYKEKDIEGNEQEKPNKLVMYFNGFADFDNKDDEIKVYSYYTKAHISKLNFYLGYAWEDGAVNQPVMGELLTTNAPTVEFKNGYDYEVNDKSGGKIVMYIEATDYYKFKTMGSSGVKFYGTTGETTNVDFNIRISVDYANLFGKGVAEEYENKFNALPSEYLKVSSVELCQKGTTKDASKKFEQDTYVITFNYTQGYDGDRVDIDAGLQAGAYSIDIICENVEYGLNLGTKFIDDKEDVDKFKDDWNSGIKTSVKKSTEVEYSAEIESVNYADEIDLKTELGDKNGYVFYGWYRKVNSSNGNGGYFSFSSETTGLLYSELNNQDGQNNVSITEGGAEVVGAFDRFKIDVYAVYVKKQTELSFGSNSSIRYRIENYNDTGTDKTSTNPANEILTKIQLQDKNGEVIKNLSYSYNSSDESYSTKLNSLKVVVTGGLWAEAYYVAGLAVVDFDNQIIKKTDGLDMVYYGYEFNLYDDIKEKLENDASLGENTKFYLLPILRQKRITAVFHSGTGDLSNTYGDTKNGKIFDKYGNKIEDNSVAYKIEGLIFNYSTVNTTQIINEHFYSRTGYKNNIYGYYWVKDDNNYSSSFKMKINLFEGVIDGGSIHFYRLWETRDYRIVFDVNNGTWKNKIEVIVQTYDNKVTSTLPQEKDVRRTGYQFMGWSTDANGLDKIFNADGSLYDIDPDDDSGNLNSLFDKNGCYINSSDITLYAIWEAKAYNFKIYFNGANSINGIDISETQTEYCQTYTIVYDTTFERIYIGETVGTDSESISLADILPERLGFKFKEMYMVDAGVLQSVTSATLFNSSLSVFIDNQSDALSLYVGWSFDSNYLGIVVVDDQLETTYNATLHTVYVDEYFGDGNFTAKNIVVDKSSGDIDFGIDQDMYVTLSTTLTNINVVDVSGFAFKVRDVGDYSVVLEFVLKDNAKYINLGQIWSSSIILNFTVNQASLSVSQTVDTNFDDAKRIMQPFYKQGALDIATDMLSLARISDSSISETLSVSEMYSYLMIKYYKLLTTNDITQHNLYKGWTYGDYQTYTTLNDVESLLNSLKNFDFYDYTFSEINSLGSGGIKDISSIYTPSIYTLDGNYSELITESVKVYTDSTIDTYNSYDIRVYVTAGSEQTLNNYALNVDEENNAYLTVGKLYILPQIFDIENIGETKSYYQAYPSKIKIRWEGESESIEYLGNEYYLVDSNEKYYLSAGVYTSGNGDQKYDTVFSYYDNEKSIYITDVRLIDENYSDLTSNFKFIMSTDYTVMNISDVAQIDVVAKYLTVDGGYLSSDLDGDEYLRITKVTYNVDGSVITKEDKNGLEVGLFVAKNSLGDSIPIYEIKQNNDGKVSLFANSSLLSVTVITPNTNIGNYRSLYKWSSVFENYIDGTMESDNSTTFNFDFDMVNKTFKVTSSHGDNFSTAEDGLVNIEYYAIFTDLVKVDYNYNLGEMGGSGIDVLKLGYSTYNDLNLPKVSGFVLETLTEEYTEFDILVESNRNNVFRNGGVFIGLSDENPYRPLIFDAKWSIERLEFKQLLTNLTSSVYSLSTLYASQVVSLSSINENYFSYKYEWQYRKDSTEEWGKPNSAVIMTENKLVSEVLTLKNSGSLSESGCYKLKIVVTILPEYVGGIVDVTHETQSDEVEFVLEFKRLNITKIELSNGQPLEDQTSTFNNKDQRNITLKISYHIYDSDLNDYSTEIETMEQGYSTTGAIVYEIKDSSGMFVTNVINVGTYDYEIKFDDDLYDVSGLDAEDGKFKLVIVPAEFDLKDIDFDASKKFNAVDTKLSKNIYIATLNDTVSVELSRGAGEDVGEYDIFIQKIVSTNLLNYVLKYDETELMRDGILTAEGSVTKIGTFTINPADKLILSYDIASENKHIILPYISEGYGVRFEGTKILITKYGTTDLLKELDIKCFDYGTSSELTNAEILNLVTAQLYSLEICFNKIEDKIFAKDSGTYSYKVINSTEMGKYYMNVEFDEDFTFSIERQEIDVSEFVFEKIYDKTNKLYLRLDKTKIEDIDTYAGIYIEATYASMHVAESIHVDLKLISKGGTELLNNYSLSSDVSTGRITKRYANLIINLKKSEYKYGEVEKSSLTKLIDSVQLTDDDGNDLSSLVMSGYCSIVYSLAESVEASNGFVCVGTYNLTVDAHYDDFNVTLKNSPVFTVSKLIIEKTIAEGTFVMSTSEKLEKFNMELSLGTGQQIVLELEAEDVDVDVEGKPTACGLYNLTFTGGVTEKDFLNSNVKVKLNANNNGLKVADSQKALYVTLAGELEERTYDGKGYKISVSNEKLVISNEDDSWSVEVGFVVKNADGDLVVGKVSDISVTNEITGDVTISKNAGTYRLIFSATVSGEYSDVIFGSYSFVINKKEINVDKLSDVKKQYDGGASYNIEDFDGKVEDDDLLILANFNNETVGSGKTVGLLLVGNDRINYTLSSSLTTGEIIKADATVKLFATEFDYGDLSKTNSITYSVVTDEKEIAKIYYNIKFLWKTTLGTVVDDDDYSGNYLNVGKYIVSLDETNSSSTNYNLNFVETEITISKYQLDVVFDEAGGYKVSYGDEKNQVATFTANYITPLNEEIELELTRSANINGSLVELGDYYVEDATTTNVNYRIASVVDNSGYYRIIKGTEIIYLLLSESATVSANGNDGRELSFEYDGNIYDCVEVEQTVTGVRLVVYSTVGTPKRYFDLNPYKFDGSLYVKCSDFITFENLDTSLYFVSNAKDVGNYTIGVARSVSNNYEVRIGKNGATQFNLSISKKKLYLKADSSLGDISIEVDDINNKIYIETVFTNKSTRFSFEDASDIIVGLEDDGIVAGETIGMDFTIYTNPTKSEIAKYVESYSTFDLTLTGEFLDNYDFNLKVLNSTKSIIDYDIFGKITTAPMVITINSQSVTYGENIKIEYEYSADVDWTGYDFNRISVNFNVDGSSSSSGKLNVNESGYDLNLNVITLTDFYIDKYVVNGAQQATMTGAKIIVKAKGLKLQQKSGGDTIKNIFTKIYDGSSTVFNASTPENLPFDLVGLITGDKIEVSANYASETIGDYIDVIFNLGGNDGKNYKILSINGSIMPIIITIQYSNRDGKESDVTQAGRDELTEIKYPLVGSSLTANSNSTTTSTTYNFPNTIYNTGYTFLHWIMEFEIENSSAYDFLVEKTKGMICDYVDNVFTVVVGNDDRTVKLLNSLIDDPNDHFGLYYKNNSTPIITFKAVYSVQKVRLSINIVNNNDINEKVEWGTVNVSYNGAVEHFQESSFIEVEYGTELEMFSAGKEHYYFVGYNIDGSVQTNPNYTIDKITDATTVYVMFDAQKVNVIYDLSGLDLTTITIPEMFELQTGGKYKWASDYASVYDKTVSDILLEKVGYDVSRMMIKIDGIGTAISSEEFDITTIGDRLIGATNDSIEVVLTPTFTAKDIAVVLVYNYNGETKTIYVPYEKTYGEAKMSSWEDSPVREGHEFEGWWTQDGLAGAWGELITSDSVLTSANEHSLYARWGVASYKVELSTKNATIINSSVEFVEDDGKWILEAVEYGTEITFTLIPNSGYMVLESGWLDCFEVVRNADKSALVKISIPGEDVVFEMPTGPEMNKVSLTGEKIKKMIYTIDSNDVGVDLADPFETDFEVETNEIVEIKFEMFAGYQISTINIDDIDGLYITNIYNTSDNNVLIGVKIEGIYQDIAIKVSTMPRENKIDFVVDFGERVDEIIDSDGYIANLIDNKITYTKETGSVLTLKISYNTGFEFLSVTSDKFIVDCTDGISIVISGICTDGTVLLNTKKTKYTVVAKTISYEADMSKVDILGNIVYVNGLTTGDEFEIGQSITLSNDVSGEYNFAGWSKDGESTFDTNATIIYTLNVDDVEKYASGTSICFYGIFSKLQFRITFGTFSYYTVGTEYDDEDRLEKKYIDINGTYVDESGLEITSINIYYGTEQTIMFKVPIGYTYYGYGYIDASGFRLLGQNESSDRTIKIRLVSTQLSDEMKIYFLVRPMSARLSLKNKINFDGVYETDTDVGSTTIYGANGSYFINEYGYVDGTRVYIENYTSGLSDKEISVVSYSGDEIYIKVKVLRDGYKFQTVTASGSLQTALVEKTAGYTIYKIFNIIGGETNEIDILFKPQIHVINLSYTNKENITDGGAFSILKSAENNNKVFTSGKEYSSLVVSAYTDSNFEVIAFIRAGFYVNVENLEFNILDNGNIIVPNSLSYQRLSVIETGYSGMIKFKVEGYMGQNDISISLQPEKYTVNLKDGENVLATIKNVEFDSLLNLSENNKENIEIVDRNRVAFVENRLNVIITLENYNFQGYFTSQNGAGVRYIDSNGDSIKTWSESGYVFDNLTASYVLSQNAHINEETNEMTIDLYIYQAYLKTRISFELLPSIDSNITAQDMVIGVDYSNSWFYATSAMYIEISYNTDIYLLAPEFEGYTFYKFIISQKNGDGTWLTDVESLSNNVPWSTNEIANIVECKVVIVYYAKINVQIIGGEGRYVISQNGTPTEMLNNGYVDTSKEFTVSAISETGYEFLYWKNNGLITTNSSITISTKNQVNLQMYLQGLATALNFEAYDPTFGQIHSLRVVSQDGSFKNIRVGAFSGSDFIKIITETSTTVESQKIKVGDIVTFVVSMNYGFGVIWNRNDIVYNDYTDGYYYFTLEINSSFAGQTVEIIPTFDDEVLAVYLTRKFDDVNEKAIDLNFVDMAGVLAYNGRKVNSFTVTGEQDVVVNAETKMRYKILSVTVYNYDRVYTNIENVLTEQNQIVLTNEFIDANNIVGNINIEVTYTRVLWEETSVADMFEGKGTRKNKYKIKSEQDLALMMQLINSSAENSKGLAYKDAYYSLETDLDLSNYFWTPIGTELNAFNGDFDFNDHNIIGVYNAYFFNPIHYNGLFGVLGNDAKIHLGSKDIWYIYLSIGGGVTLVLSLIVIIVVNKKRKKRRQVLANK